MSSSDSDEDIYGNVLKKLDKIRENYKREELKTKNLEETNKSVQDDSFIFLDEINDTDSKNSNEELELSLLSRRKTKRKPSVKGKPSKRARKTKKTESSVSSNIGIIEIIDTPSPSKKAGKGTSKRRSATPKAKAKANSNRGRQKVKPRRQTNKFPTYSVGNTDEYPDELEDVSLFSSTRNNKDNDVIVIDDPVTDQNEELSVKVYWRSIDIYKFEIRKFQKFTHIFNFFAKKENVSKQQLLFTYNDNILQPDDSPDSINYNIAKFIDGGIIYNNVMTTVSKPSNKKTSGVKIKFQCPESKKPFELFVERDEKLSLAMTLCAEHLELPLSKLRFEFDGDYISGSDSMTDLDMEGDECIDVKIIS